MRAVRRLVGAPFAHSAILRAAGLAVLVSAVVLPGAISTSGASEPNSSGFPSGYVDIHGHGWGPGVGMGQWGAFGYAASYHKSYQWILSHFYGGTSLSSLAPSGEGSIRVAILENSGYPVTVTSESAFSFGGVSFAAGTAARAVMNTATGQFSIEKAASCRATGSSWKILKTKITTDPVAIPASLHPTAPAKDLLVLCRADGVDEMVRGRIIAYRYDNANTGYKPLIRTLNQLPVESYVADVTPSESSSGWGQVGGSGLQGEPWGFQELEAQAVAARTYLLAYERAGGWYGYASICDSDYCQSYPGVTNESAIADAAVRDTAGQYLSSKGEPISAQYSASTGGYTVPGSFPAVADAGDAVCLQGTPYWTCNPVHNWTADIPVATVEADLPPVGTLESLTVIKRNGLGAWGGRVLEIRIVGSSGTVTESGDAFSSQLALDSNWFIIDQPSTTTTTTTTLPPSSTTTTLKKTTTTTTLKKTTTTTTKRPAPNFPKPTIPGHMGMATGTGPIPAGGGSGARG
jgi:SpoIID/LytB domain protein